jgi:hypothetical protein
MQRDEIMAEPPIVLNREISVTSPMMSVRKRRGMSKKEGKGENGFKFPKLIKIES